MKAHEIIIEPIISEKSSILAEQKQYGFWVHSRASKIAIKNAIKQIYATDVAKITVSYQRPKYRSARKGTFAKRQEMKKAFVTLKNKASFDFTKFGKEEKEVKVITKKAAPKKASEKAAKEVKKEKKTTKSTK